MKFMISALILCFALTTHSVKSQTTITVGPTGDYATISAAHTAASSGDIIHVDLDGYLTEGDISITKNLTIQGNGAGTTFVQAETTRQSAADKRVFFISGGAVVAIKDMTIQHGYKTTGTGPGILVSGSTLTLDKVHIVDNVNIYNAAIGGGLYAYNSTVTITNSTVNDNEVGGGVGTSGNGGGIGWQADNAVNTLTIVNSTISGNSAEAHGGGIYHGCTDGNGPVKLSFVTIYDNIANSDDADAGEGGGIYAIWGPLQIKNSILAGNTNPSKQYPDFLGGDNFNSDGYNLIGNAGNSSFSTNTTGDNYGDPNGSVTPNAGATESATAVDPKLNAISDNGGTTPTCALQSDSPAKNTGNSTDVDGNSITNDQRIYVRSDGTNDKGAYEFGAVVPVELLTFIAHFKSDHVVLEWKTATEVNNYGFELQKLYMNTYTTAEVDWLKIGFVAGAGNSNSVKEYRFVDTDLSDGYKFKYRLKQIDIDGQYEYSNEVEVLLPLPQKSKLFSNYPNPFNPSTAINYSLSRRELINLKIFDLLGREVITLFSGVKNAGYHATHWNGRDKYGEQVSSGTYIYRLQTDNFLETKKMLLIK